MEFIEYSAKQKAVEKALKQFFPVASKFDRLIYEAMQYSLFVGGKRFRPVLLLMVYEAFKDNFETALPSACAIEYIHTYSLIHDDLPAIDNDDLRRGMPTNHKKYGEAIALLAGDALFAEAFNLIAGRQKAKAQDLVDIIEILASSSGASGMVGGQVADVKATGQKSTTPKQLLYIHSHKTGKLIEAAAKIGTKLAGANTRQMMAIEDFAYHLGMAFQITDDILDETGETDVLGKTAGSDRKQKKATYPAVFGLAQAKKQAIESSERAIASLDSIKSDNLVSLARMVIRRQI